MFKNPTSGDFCNRKPEFQKFYGAQKSIPRNLLSLCTSLAVRYDNPIPSRWRMWYQFPQIHSRSLPPPFLANISPPFPSWPIILASDVSKCVCVCEGEKCYVVKQYCIMYRMVKVDDGTLKNVLLN
jgi:hypothetical protein